MRQSAQAYMRGNWYRTLMPAPLSFPKITRSVGFTSCCIASQQASVDALPIRTELQSSLELTTTLVAPCAAQLEPQHESKMIDRNHNRASQKL
jgi:hypothetical protein